MRRRSTLHTTTRSTLLPLPVDQVWPVVASGYVRPQWYVEAAPFVFRAGLDRLVGGKGAAAKPPGRPVLTTGDRAGFWMVTDADHQRHRLVLEADVRAPGQVILTSSLEESSGAEGPGCRLTQVVEFVPRGLAGRVYLLSDLGAREVVMELAHRRLLADVRRAQVSRPGS